MKLFNHITDFGTEGMQNLYPMAAVAEKVILWAPSAFYINEAREAGHTSFTPSDIVELVEAEVITIMCREWWLDRDERLKIYKERRQPFYKWDPDFDGAISDLNKERKQKNKRTQYVIVQDLEPGEQYPDKVFEDPENEIHARDLKYAKLLLHEGNFAPLLKKKIESTSNKKAKLGIILRDIINHREAYKNSGAEWAVIESENARLYSEAIMSPVRARTPTDVDIEQIFPLMKTISALNKDQRRENLLEILKSKELAKAKRDAENFLQPGQVLSHDLRKEIESNTPGLKKVLKGAGFTEVVSSGMGFILDIANIQTHISPYWSFAPASFPITRAALEIGNMIPASYKGETFPFVMAMGTKRPKRRHLHQASQFLKDIEIEAEN